MANVVTSSVLDLASVGTIFYDGARNYCFSSLWWRASIYRLSLPPFSEKCAAGIYEWFLFSGVARRGFFIL